MITELRLQNFKSWKDTGPMRFAPLTGFFGPNSSGKSAILQFLLMLKQTVESADRNTVLAFNGPYTELGTFRDVVSNHKIPGDICYSIKWTEEFSIWLALSSDQASKNEEIDEIEFTADVSGDEGSLITKGFKYKFNVLGADSYIGVERTSSVGDSIDRYQLSYDGSGELKKLLRHSTRKLNSPIKGFAFPDKARGLNSLQIISDLEFAYEQLFQSVFYLGPLRDYPHRIYIWGGGQPQDVGVRGENFVAALLASQARKMGVEERVAHWLKELGLVHSFKVQPIAEGRQEYEVLVKRTKYATEVPITDVGFGVSQILPVLTLCYYVPEFSTIILEQPEIHLHPAVQAGLADVLIDVANERDIQIILESHSEHLLRRLQRRIAEGKFANEDAALYFCEMDEQGASHLKPLELNEYGYVTNWPEDFFGDEMDDLVAQSKAATQREQEKGAAQKETTKPQEAAA